MRTFVAWALMAASACVANGQPVQWRVEDGGNGHWYECTEHLGTWDQMRSLAVALGADLVSISGATENQFAWQRVFEAHGATGIAWIGARKLSGQPWSWSDGTNWFFFNWAPGEPCCGDSGLWVHLQGPSGWWQDHNQRDYPAAGLLEYSADCNGDGIVDKGQILSGQLPDANNNGIPDWSVNIITQPTNQSVGVDQPVFFVVEASTTPNCTTPINYRWQRRNPVVLDDNAPNAWIDLQDGGGFLNTATASMTILRPTAGLATGYRCKISGGCGCEGLSNGVVYTNIVNFAPACPSDFNNDGSVDGDDVIAFFERWDGGC